MLHIKLKGIINPATRKQIFYPQTPTQPHPLTLVVGSKGQNSTFSEHGHVAYQIKWNPEYSAALLQIFWPQTIPLLDPVYQSQWNHECSNMEANILPLPPSKNFDCRRPTTLGCGQKVKFNFFRTWSLLHIKLKGITKAKTW